jgi:hypothetical protein
MASRPTSEGLASHFSRGSPRSPPRRQRLHRRAAAPRDRFRSRTDDRCAGGGLKLERGDAATIGAAHTWVTRFTFDQTNFLFSTPGSSYTGIKLSNSGTTSGRMHMAIGDSVGLTINAKFEANKSPLRI